MTDYFEIDFLDVESNKSGDAITIRYQINNEVYIHVTDGGFQATGDSLISHINKYYGSPGYIDAVIATHPDGDHAGGLRKLFGTYSIGGLWMLRPWLYADELIHRFSRFSSVDNLIKRLKDLYPNIAELERLAYENGVQIYEPFQGTRIKAFTVLAPTKQRYLDLIVDSERTPESVNEAQRSLGQAVGLLGQNILALARAAWGQETFPPDDTSAENNMSIVQYANLCQQKILLTADAGRAALDEAADFAPYVGLQLPGIDRFQIPHHGSRHNVSTELLDKWLGPRLNGQPQEESTSFSAIVSAASADKDHPRKSVIRAFMHRGGRVISTEGQNIQSSRNAPDREGYSPATPYSYPQDQEE